MNITLKDGSVMQVNAGATAAQAAQQISGGLYRAACAARVNGKTVDLRTELTEGCTLEILTFDDPEGKRAFWHTTSHYSRRRNLRSDRRLITDFIMISICPVR